MKKRDCSRENGMLKTYWVFNVGAFSVCFCNRKILSMAIVVAMLFSVFQGRLYLGGNPENIAYADSDSDFEYVHSGNFGGKNSELFEGLTATSDGGYVAVGQSNGVSTSPIWGNNGNIDGIIVKYDIDGNVKWSKNAGGSNGEGFVRVAATSDGGYVAVGNSYGASTTPVWGNNGDSDGIIVKYDVDGDVKWSTNVGGTTEDHLNDVVKTSDGGCVVVGYSMGASTSPAWGNNGGSDGIIVKYDVDGNVKWSKNAGGSNGEGFIGVAATSDGGYVAVGNSYGASTTPVWGNNGDSDGIIVKYDADGNVKWSKNVGGTDFDVFWGVAATSDGGYIAVGNSYGVSATPVWGNNGDSDGIIVKYDADGNVKWSTNVGGTSYDVFWGVAATSDGGYVAVGESDGASTSSTWENNGESDGIIVKCDVGGNVKWSKNVGGTYYDALHDAAETSDGGYVAVGYSDSTSTTPAWGNNGESDAIVAKTQETVEVVKVVLTPDATSKNAGYDGHIDVSFDDATAVGRQAYALGIPMVFDNDTIEITNLETVDFDTKGLTGLLVNGTFLSGARDYDASSEVLSVINATGKFLLSWTVEENVPLTPHTLTDDVYFTIHYRVKENVATSESFAIGEYNDTNGITGDQIFGIDGRGILSSNQDDFGAYLLVDGEHGILTQDYINVTVEDMPPVTISGDVNSISLQGRAMLTGKQRTAISAIGYTPNLSKIDAGIRVEMYEVDDVGEIIKQVGSVAYTQEMNMTAAIGDTSSTLYNYTLNIPRTVANDLKISDPDDESPKYMLRFSRFGDNGGSVVGTVREESYLWANIYLDGTSVNTGAIDESTPLTVGGTAYLYAGAFYLPTAEKDALTTADLNTIKGQVGNADIAGVTTIYNINEYLGVDAADYTTVLRYVGQQKLQSLPLAVTN
ncbi:MAG: hypothetical protein LBL34_00505 [Clostridiales bacterium]|jgi:hypothetical protein|nr:hypothetical protein [Clostridiales bacterium]